jgi:hypothetical protein
VATNTDHPRPFRYLADPLCIAVLALYCLNRFLLRPHHLAGQFAHDHLNDLLCLPLFIPIVLRTQSLLRIRRHDAPPTLFEILHNWAIFSILYELVLPRLPIFNSAADPYDVLAYLTGGLLAYAYWNRTTPSREFRYNPICEASHSP